ncbi:hypothetical protein CC85DRAFT_329295 [Cutaneotrichosporon oleaginosum]|uniref:PinX1-related protein 1 n=1 Tax=Cutaneotrichosporon oleaginosum TaxID=879819 RepID=A0A0J0XJD8_9TREE|nr:uncharacterized protein CC85DRAFT_329295 [Cutaneotrichosporon oleaginosum]KLT41193.1 hypothetical protein CC85DRAFT_329295 [Cutaneotrichosporon oleaginosum]TXT14090.1 hypothetical protein COLE_00283 [Cutaneotrichosporon oleaginosum]
MGLAERKQKQRIGYDPRNLSWSEDKNRFGVQHMSNLGWQENTGLGKDASGNAKHIAVVRKMDNGGIGMMRLQKEGKELGVGAGQAGAGLEDVLKRLAARSSASATPSLQPSPALSPAPSPGPSVVRNKISSRQRHLASKKMASQDPVALAAILGVPVSSLPTPATSAPVSGASTPASESTPELASRDENGDPQRNALEVITTSTLSVSDYFRRKLREKMLQRQASGSATPTLAEGSLAVMKEEVKVDVGGVAWEGSKVSFAETEVKISLGDLGADAPAVNADKEAEKAAKKARKEAKRAAKAAEKEATTESTPATSTSESPVTSESTPAVSDKEVRKAEKEAKKREKEEKRRKKEEKAANKAEKEQRKAEKEAKKEGKDKKRKRGNDADEDSKKRKSG